MDGAGSMGVVDGIWYYDNTKHPGLLKQRNVAKYPASEQDFSNEALRNNVRVLKLPDPRTGYEASVNLETMEQICQDILRHM